ncbi:MULTISPECIES: Bug family tripartite tricarboxylate transporter substrate binding protein [Comamonas]|uniref:Bug family tripartite tricarboxylate transporter substrate binding protein n=1 Tax=Comamonas TaxID=283 RepID=UPI00050F0E79|nr:MULTISPECIES: Bug family tripartite tricarboxylate transporter substrate binding protein [Comamonas]KGG84038.1 twin-arginine translocation pathway signal protein [Comamonas thiooxydans]KGG86135.1 twin-arginine translocation pathway signal protein [Comamonas thiooxydans]KGG94249.1 twin-arginine translocation pathway signal protein [Comamonas thiooxydans]KGG99688.1 twin-arginine translocation pathway signal protein [Comamonas thiooxydans]KGH04885.1 twin-arginine translocation pathway signal p
MNFNRREWLQAAGAGSAGALLSGLGLPALAQAPLENLNIITGFAAGGTSDAICRRVGTKLAAYAKAVVVENRTGAGGQIAINYVKGRPADGSVMLQTPTSMLTIYPHIYKKLGYDPVADLTPVTVGCIFDFGFAVGPMVPASVTTVPEFFAWVKTHPDGASFGSPAAGSTPHFVGALLGQQAGVDFKHVGYRGSQPALMDMMGGNIAAVSCPVGDAMQHAASGKMRLLGVSGAKRNRFMPKVPTYTEQGYKNMAHSEWFGFFLPAKAKPDQVERLNAQMRQALASPDVVDSLAVFGLEAMSSSSAELAALIKEDLAKWAPIVKQVGFTAEA